MIRVTIEKLTDESLMRELASETTGGKECKVSLARMYAAMHSPARSQMFTVRMENIPTFVSVHLVRHKIGVEHFVKSNREDRGGDGKADRDTPVNHTMLINAEAIVHMAHKRLCQKAHPKTVGLVEQIKFTLEAVDPELAKLMVPLCVYRNGLCDELPKPCGFNKTIKIATEV